MRTTCHHCVLIVDDDEDDRYILEHSFREIQWATYVRFLDSGDHLLEYLSTLSAPGAYPSVILLDYNMPRMGADEILARLRQQEAYRQIKVMVYSTGMNEALSSRLKNLGAWGCYNKSIDISGALQLASALRQEAQPPPTIASP